MHMVIVSLLRNAELEALLAGSDQSGRKVLEGRKLTESVLTHTHPQPKSPTAVLCPAQLVWRRSHSWMEFAGPCTCRFYQLP